MGPSKKVSTFTQYHTLSGTPFLFTAVRMKKKKESNPPAAKVAGKSRKRLVVAKVKVQGKRKGTPVNTEATLPKKVSRGADEEME